MSRSQCPFKEKKYPKREKKATSFSTLFSKKTRFYKTPFTLLLIINKKNTDQLLSAYTVTRLNLNNLRFLEKKRGTTELVFTHC